MSGFCIFFMHQKVFASASRLVVLAPFPPLKWDDGSVQTDNEYKLQTEALAAESEIVKAARHKSSESMYADWVLCVCLRACVPSVHLTVKRELAGSNRGSIQ